MSIGAPFEIFGTIVHHRGLLRQMVIRDLTGYLQQRCPTQRCFIGDWGLGTQVLTLAGGQLAIEEMFWPYINTAARPPEQQRRNSARAMARTGARVMKDVPNWSTLVYTGPNVRREKTYDTKKL